MPNGRVRGSERSERCFAFSPKKQEQLTALASPLIRPSLSGLFGRFDLLPASGEKEKRLRDSYSRVAFGA